MALTCEDVHYIARLARLDLSAAEEEKLVHEMGAILGYMDQLNALDTTDVPPMTHVLDLHNVFRADIPEQRITHEEALANGPDTDGDYFRVPRVIE